MRSVRLLVALSAVLISLVYLDLSTSSRLLVQAQPSGYDNNNNYGYDNDPNDGYGSSSQQPSDSLYHDYAVRQQEKEIGGAGIGNAGAGGMAGWTRMLAGGAVGWFLGGKYHSGKLAKKLNAKHKQDQKVLYQQYYNDVYALQQQNSELLLALEKQYGGPTAATSNTGAARRKA